VNKQKKHVSRPIYFRKPTAVKSPSSHHHYLRKSPSPSGLGTKSKTPTPPECQYQFVQGQGQKGYSIPSTSPTDDSLSTGTAWCPGTQSGASKKRTSLSPQTEIKEIVRYQNEQERKSFTNSKTLGQLHFRIR
jgi:hypothetical protein